MNYDSATYNYTYDPRDIPTTNPETPIKTIRNHVEGLKCSLSEMYHLLNECETVMYGAGQFPGTDPKQEPTSLFDELSDLNDIVREMVSQLIRIRERLC